MDGPMMILASSMPRQNRGKNQDAGNTSVISHSPLALHVYSRRIEELA